tara:strand:+ start:5125 stop:6939 length:1815 start_codon:yes stop_codon:yes gene_type:complete
MNYKKEDKVRIGCASGFWGDTTTAAKQLVEKGNLDYLVFDFLSEVTMSILAKAKIKNPDYGFTVDFVHQLNPLWKEIKTQNIKVISNAGGINLESCKKSIQNELINQNIDLKVAVVLGDDLTDQKDELEKLAIKEWETEEPLPESCLSMNAYLGYLGIYQALNEGADIVITGRCVDSALVLGPLAYEFKWSTDDYDLLASGSLAGHIIECGAQCTGGNFTDWEKIQGFDNIGFPIIEAKSNGEFIVTKPPETGGLVSFGTISEQLLYEIGNPNNYFLPDVVCDFTNVIIREISKNKVLVKGARGISPTESYKVSATYLDGFKAGATLVIGGRKAQKKADIIAKAILSKVRRILIENGMDDFQDTNLSIIGTDSIYGLKRTDKKSKEVVMRLMVKHYNEKALRIFSKEIAQAVTGMTAGVINYMGGRPTVSPSVHLFSFLIPKNFINIDVEINQSKSQVKMPTLPKFSKKEDVNLNGYDNNDFSNLKTKVDLEKLAYARSGDKGDHVNIGIIARKSSYFPYIRDALKIEVVSKYFEHFLKGEVQRWDVPGVYGLNFLLKNALGGGGMASLYLDPQGKGYAQMLLELPIPVPELIYNDLQKYKESD